ncbi:transcriptional regulator [Herbaspirillum sp. meg3]|uniref:STAS domain-containing protein n=1 Tax=Herbaspirillum sp. meg3 TaxID=2025949 RepID=UPI000B98342D|nr:STAS domain-containing protein [Herbaspirillum sp. meg3]ASU36986.1 transcriptional regulator [Herbaspirillum sp. meg3]
MKVEAVHSKQVLIIQAAGSLDIAGARELAIQLQNHCDPDLQNMILDFSRVDALGSAGLQVLYLLSKKARSRGAHLVAVGLQPEVREVFDSSGFVAFYKILDSVEDGLDALSRDATLSPL